MSEREKTQILRAFRKTNRKTQQQLACRYLLHMRKGNGQIGWLLFLREELAEEFDLC